MKKRSMLEFDKRFKNDEYAIFFNTKTGVEITEGINGNPDPFVLEMPSLLDIGIMGSCPNKCSFCYQGHSSEPNMTLENFKKIIDQSKYHVNQVALGGRGDPNKHEHFKEIIEYARNNNVVPNYTTSGIGLTDEEVETSKSCGAVAVSDYEKDFTYKAINMFLDAGIKTNIHQIFSSGSINKCNQILHGNIWKTNFDIQKLNAVIFLLFKPKGAGENLNISPNHTQLKLFADLMFSVNPPFKIGMDSCLVNHVVHHKSLTTLQKMSIDTCEGARMSGYITPDMKFMPCSFANKDNAVRILIHPMKQVWKYSSTFIKFRESLEKQRNICPITIGL